MPLTQEAIDELRRIYKKEFGKDLSEEEAWSMGYRLAELGRIIIEHSATEERKKKEEEEKDPPADPEGETSQPQLPLKF